MQFSYDAKDRLLERIDARGVVNRLRYDAVGNVLENTENATGLCAGPRSKTYRYSLANLGEQVEPNGLKTTFEYDRVYNMTRKIAENRWLDTLNGNVERLELQVCEYRYDLNNRMIEEITDPAGLALQVLALRRARRPHRRDRPQRKHHPHLFRRGGRPIFTVDPLGHVKEALRRGGQRHYGDPVRQPGFDGGIDGPHASHGDRRSEQRPHRRVHVRQGRSPHRHQARRGPSLRRRDVGRRPPATTTDAYDGVGNVVRQTDANGHTTYHYFDGNGLEIGSIDAEASSPSTSSTPLATDGRDPVPGPTAPPARRRRKASTFAPTHPWARAG